MPELTREEKLKMIEKLPQQLQDFLYSEDTGASLLSLGRKYNLPDEKVHLLSKLVADVVLKIVPITSLAQEINSKITSDAQAAMNLAQELYAELLAPVITAPSAPLVSAAPTPAPMSVPAPPRPITPSAPPADRYREPVAGPEVVDLRKTPPAVSKVEPPPAPSLPPKPITVPPAPAPAPAPAPITPTPPLTFTRPVEPAAPLIEAEPHKIPSPTPKPQYIMRPSGLPPTDVPDNVLDLRKDRGEF